MKPADKKEENVFSQQVGEKEVRKLKAQKEHKRSVWLGLGMFGMVGWAVAVPTLLGVAIGIKLDHVYPVSFSWTLTFLMLGLCTGGLIAWRWVLKEDKEMYQDKSDKDE